MTYNVNHFKQKVPEKKVLAGKSLRVSAMLGDLEYNLAEANLDAWDIAGKGSKTKKCEDWWLEKMTNELELPGGKGIAHVS